MYELGDLSRATQRGGRGARGVGGETTELPIQADRPQAGGRSDHIVADVVDLECAGIDVAQHKVGRAGCMHRADAGDLPFVRMLKSGLLPPISSIRRSAWLWDAD
jgi:hypothetical protein